MYFLPVISQIKVCSKRDANLDKLARSLALVLLSHFGNTPARFNVCRSMVAIRVFLRDDEYIIEPVTKDTFSDWFL